MQYRKLGTAGTKVSAISLGGWINFEAKLPKKEAQSIIGLAIERGINFFDMADVYGYGKSEKWMGKMLRDYPRHTLVLSTKVFGQMSSDVNDRGLSRKHIMESIDKSLRRLGTDYVDIYFCHRPDPDTPILETTRAMTDLIHMGKVVYWGTSMWEPEQLAEAHNLAERYQLVPPQVEQPQYSMLYRERVETKIIPAAQKYGLGLTAFSPLAMGMLTGKYDDGIPEESRFAKETWAKDEVFNEAARQKVLRLKPIAEDLGMTRGQLALAWLLRHPEVSTVLTAATLASQVAENVSAADVTLSTEALAAVEAALA